MKKNKIGFTLVEILVVVFIISLISSLVIVSISGSRQKARDAKRISDITQIQIALENYHQIENSYPSELVAGQSLVGSSTGIVFLIKVPENPSYYDFNCQSSGYEYFYDSFNGVYDISFCLESGVDNFLSGSKCVTPSGISEGLCFDTFYSPAQIWNLVSNYAYIPVASFEELNSLRNVLSQTMGSGTAWEGDYLTGIDKKYIQVDDIDISSYSLWMPLSDDVSRFTGVYDGNGLSIDNLNIDTSDSSYRYASLFGVLNNAEIRNIKLDNLYINYSGATTFVTYGFGGIAAIQMGSDSVIENCEVYGNVYSSGPYVGGIVGNNYRSGSVGGAIKNCVFSGDLIGTNYVGGITGNSAGSSAYMYKNRVFNSYIVAQQRFVGGVIGTNNDNALIEYSAAINIHVDSQSNLSNSIVGGFVGGNYGIIKKSFATGLVRATGSGSNNVGGFVSDNGYSIEDCYSQVTVNSSGFYVGGFVGFNNGASASITNSYSTGLIVNSGEGFGGVNLATIANSYWDIESSGKSSSSGGIGKTTSEMKTGTPSASIYNNWQASVWRFAPETDYPRILEVLSWQ